MTQRILNAVPTPEAEITGEQRATLDLVTLPVRKIVGMIPPRQDQGGTGTCVAHAAYILYGHHFKAKYGRFPLIGEPEILRFYDMCVAVEGRTDPERAFGIFSVTAMRVMKGSGWPLADGKRGPRIKGYEYVGNGYQQVRQSIAQYDDPVYVAMSWDAAWMGLPPSRILKVPVGQMIGGHALGAFGYDDAHPVAREALALMNSWGRWSAKGNGMCYQRDEYTTDRWFEAWRVTGME